MYSLNRLSIVVVIDLFTIYFDFVKMSFRIMRSYTFSSHLSWKYHIIGI